MMKFRVGHGYDVHSLEQGLPLVLCGETLQHSKGCVAHSDGDVALHALCDALLGAAAMGDIGKHFPDTDNKYKGIDSRVLLRECASLLAGQGYSISNIDITIAAQQPKLSPHINQMRENISHDLALELADVSVKATTTERLGFVGREEGIEAHAVVMIYR